MKVQFTAGDPQDRVVQEIQSDVSSWVPEAGPNWADLQTRVARRPFELVRVYGVAAAALAVILVAAYFAMASLNLGGLSWEPVVSQGAATQR
jgi:hypothetical protein